MLITSPHVSILASFRHRPSGGALVELAAGADDVGGGGGGGAAAAAGGGAAGALAAAAAMADGDRFACVGVSAAAHAGTRAAGAAPLVTLLPEVRRALGPASRAAPRAFVLGAAAASASS